MDAEFPGAIEFDWLDDTTLVVAGRVDTDPDASLLYVVNLRTATLSGDVWRLDPPSARYLIGEGGRWHTPVVSPDGEWIAFTGHPVGPGPWSADELMVVRRDGTGLKRLTVGLDRDVRDVHWESDSRHIWFATEDRGSRNLQRIDSRNGRIGPATSGSHFLLLGSIPRRGNWAVGVQSSVRTAGALVRFPLNHPDRLQALITPDREVPTGDIEEFDFRAADGTILSGWLFLPPGFVPSTQYPLLVEIHGGPHAMAGNGYAPFALAHAAAGRLVLRVNPRGSTGYGYDIANGLAQEWPGRDVADLRAAIDDIISRGSVDTTRIAAVGQGAGGVVAEALRQAERRVGQTILRCTGGAWLTGSDAPDRPIWGEWTASRPFRGLIDRWIEDSPIQTAAASRSPVLVVEGTATVAQPLAFGESLHLVLVRAGVLTSFHRLSTSCADAGPASQLDLFTLESQWLKTTH
jgi:acylaminoacyl-peptidase